LNRLDEIILFNPLADEDLLRIIDLLVGQINDTLIHRQVQIVMTPKRASGFWRRPAGIAAMARGRCGARCSVMWKTRCRKH
jgi:ATP-dependent Clp protease ATP-binding subunit ClpA